MEQFYYQLIDSRFGQAGLVWRRTGGGSAVVRIFLPRKQGAVAAAIRRAFPGAKAAVCPATKRLGLKIGRYLEGKRVDLTLAELDMSVCSPFQRQVLSRLWRVPRGKVVTYGGLAALAGHPGAARAVGTAMARNPFPPVIPCHRAVRSGGELGRFGGGTPLKKALLQMEGVEFDAPGKVSRRCLTP